MTTIVSRGGAESERSITAVLKDIAGNVQHIVRAEVRLATVELQDEAAKAKRSVMLMIAGGAVAMLALGFVLLAGVYGLATVLPAWAAALIVGAAAAAIGGLLASAGARQFKQVRLAPKTAETVRENIQWAKSQAK
jgi:uncharacterized membrane protein YqjE